MVSNIAGPSNVLDAFASSDAFDCSFYAHCIYFDDGRGHKKKKRVAIKKALIKLVLFALLIKSKLKILLTAFQTFLGFKAAVLLTVLVVTHAIKLWAEIKHHQTPQKVIYYENAHHQHHYDHDDSHDHHGWSLWGRKGEEATESSGPLSFLSPLISKRRDDASDLAYNAYNPYNDKSSYNNNKLETQRSLPSEQPLQPPPHLSASTNFRPISN